MLRNPDNNGNALTNLSGVPVKARIAYIRCHGDFCDFPADFVLSECTLKGLWKENSLIATIQNPDHFNKGEVPRPLSRSQKDDDY